MYTRPSELWPQYQYRVRYSRKTGFEVWMVEKQPGEDPRMTFVIRYGDYGQAMNWAMSRAKARSAKNLRNPNLVVVFDDLGDCAMMWLAGSIIACPPGRASYPVENPYTSPGTRWPRYQLKIEPAESYWMGNRGAPGSHRVVWKWKITMVTWVPDEERPLEQEVGFARDLGDAEKAAFDYAHKLHDKEPRNPNDIRVYNEQGRCIWSLHGSC